MTPKEQERLALTLAGFAGFKHASYDRETKLIYAILDDDTVLGLDPVNSLDDIATYIIPAIKARATGKERLLIALKHWAFQVVDTEVKPAPALAGALGSVVGVLNAEDAAELQQAE